MLQKFPKISFKSTKVEKDVVYGDLTIKGITKKNIKLNLENGGSLGWEKKIRFFTNWKNK